MNRPSTTATGGVHLRPACAADLEAALALNQANLSAVGPSSEARFRWFLDHAELFTVAVQRRAAGRARAAVPGPAEELVGFVIVLDEHSDYDSPNYRWFVQRYERFLYVDRIAVDGTRRGLGVGRALYEHVIERARRGGHERVMAEVHLVPRNDASLAFHARLGFEIAAEVPDPRYAGQLEAMVVLELGPPS